MKKLLWLGLIGLLTASACYIYVPSDRGPYGEPRTRPEYRDRYSTYGDIDIAFFYDYLSPYGVWVNYPPYGYVWLPRDVSYRWRPYSRGRWVWTDYGWTFLPRDRWGWAVHNYGRWGWDRGLGWFWVPDIVWAPAWVVWRHGNIYIGWAPVPPGIEFHRDYGFRFRDHDIPGHYWHFLDGRHFLDDDFDRYIIPYERNRTVINLTSLKGNIRVRNDRVVNEGLEPDEVRRVVRREVTRYELRDARRPEDARVQGGEVLIYKPKVNPNESAKPKSSIGRSEAERQVTQGRLRGSLLKPSPDEETLNRDHERENLVLQETQEEEVYEIRRQVEEDKRVARSEDEKKKIDEEAKVKLTEVRKRHEDEKKEVTQRQKEEKSEVTKGKIKKKD
jgi:hypothetical protein